MPFKSSKKKAGQILPFPAWMEKHYPRKTAGRSLLKMIGILDAAYLIYRLQNNGKSEAVSEKPTPVIVEQPIEQKPKPAVKPVKDSAKKVTKPKAKKIAEVKVEPELTIEFEHKPEPVAERMIEPAPAIPIEPEPMVWDEPEVEKPVKAPLRGRIEKTVWLNDERLEEVDLRKTDLNLGTDGITVAFETAYDGDDKETLIVVNGISWRAMLTSPALNLSKMVQILRVSYGELYILGRMALGAMSGDGYVTSADAADVIQSLAATGNKTAELDVRYYDKDNTSKKRTAQMIHIRFERA